MLAQRPDILLQAVTIVYGRRPFQVTPASSPTPLLRAERFGQRSELRTHLKQTLPEYMVPKTFRRLERDPPLTERERSTGSSAPART